MKVLGFNVLLMSGEMVKMLMFLKIVGNVVDGMIVLLVGFLLEEMLGGKIYVDKYKKCFGEDV